MSERDELTKRAARRTESSAAGLDESSVAGLEVSASESEAEDEELAVIEAFEAAADQAGTLPGRLSTKPRTQNRPGAWGR
jgi:hypothetical protein